MQMYGETERPLGAVVVSLHDLGDAQIVVAPPKSGRLRQIEAIDLGAARYRSSERPDSVDSCRVRLHGDWPSRYRFCGYLPLHSHRVRRNVSRRLGTLMLPQHRAVNSEPTGGKAPWITLTPRVSRNSATGTKSRSDETSTAMSWLSTQARLIMSVAMRTSTPFSSVPRISALQLGHVRTRWWQLGHAGGDRFF